MRLDWLIVGGGIHGVHIAARLVGEAGVDPEAVRMVDPADRLLARWLDCTATTGMTHLRSPLAHHLDPSPWSLNLFAGGRRARREPGLFAQPYDRPSLALFNAHCDQVIESYGLAELHIRDRVIRLSVECDGVDVRLAGGREIEAQNVVLAIGASEYPEWPEWAVRRDARVRHIFEPGADGGSTISGTVVVVGGGLSAGQVALRLVQQGHRVHLVSRHALREHQFDSDPGWLGPMNMMRFRRERDYERRRAMIKHARHRGSVTPGVRHALLVAIARHQLGWHEGMVEGLELRNDGLGLRLSGGVNLEAKHVLIATGFCTRRPGGALVDELIESASLPCARCGYPIPDTALRWHPRIYVSGPLAELELGPAARNISGARRAGDRIVNEILYRSPLRTAS